MVIYFVEPVFNNNSPVIFFLRIQRVGKEVVLPPRKLPGKSGWKVEFIPAPDGPGEQIQFDLAVPGGRSKACHGVCTNKPPSVTKQNAKIRIDHDPSRQGREKGFKKMWFFVDTIRTEKPMLWRMKANISVVSPHHSPNG
jgi:hypothetical protein